MATKLQSKKAFAKKAKLAKKLQSKASKSVAGNMKKAKATASKGKGGKARNTNPNFSTVSSPARISYATGKQGGAEG